MDMPVNGFHLMRVLGWMMGAMICFSATAIAVRSLAAQLSVFEILAIRAVLGVGFVVIVGAITGELASSIVPRRLPLHLVRNGLHFCAQSLWAWSLMLLPLATVFALEFTAPAWTMLLAIFFLGERLTRSRIVALVLGFVGVLIIVRPGLESFQPAALIVLAAALLFACAIVATKQLVMTETVTSMILWMNLIQIPLTLALSDPTFPLRLSADSIPAVIILGIAGSASNYCIANAFRAGDASVVISLDFFRIPAIAIFGWWVYGEALDLFVFVGAGLIVIGVTLSLRAEARLAKIAPIA